MSRTVGAHIGRRSVLLLATAALVVSAVVAATTGPSSASSGYQALPTPQRLADTRPGGTTVDGQFAAIGEQQAGATLDLTVAGRAGIPADATTAVLTIAAVDPTSAGFLTVHPKDTTRPNASNVNFYASHNTANTVIAGIGAGGQVSIFTSADTQLIVDVAGHLPPGTYDALPVPRRLVDTRPGGTTVDGEDAGTGLRGPGTTMDVEVAGRAGVPPDATTAVLTVAAVDPEAAGFLTVHPKGTAQPNASNVNFYAAHNTANTVVAGIGVDGKVSIFTSAATHLIVDVSGTVPAGDYSSLPAPVRLADTRPTGTTVDGQVAMTGSVIDGHQLQLPVAGRGGVPADASAAVLTVTAVDALTAGFLTGYPNGSVRPNASNVNYYAAHNTANTVIARIGDGGDVCLFASDTTHLVVDVSGWFTGPAPGPAGPECPNPDDIVYARGRDMWMMNGDGTNQRPIVTSVYVDGDPVWSRDGSKFAFIGFDDPPGSPVINPNVWTANADGTGLFNVTQIFGEDSPLSVSWSPDGTQLVFARTRGAGIHIIDADGSDVQALIVDGELHEAVDWSPDGSLILYTQAEKNGNLLTGDIEIFTIRPDGFDKTMVAPPGSFAGPTWSPDGTEIAYSVYEVPPAPQDDYADIWVMDADGTNQRNVTNEITRFDRSPNWSPDGSTILFDRAGPLEPQFGPGGVFIGLAHEPRADIFSIPAAGGPVTQLTDTEGITDQGPAWRPTP